MLHEWELKEGFAPAEEIEDARKRLHETLSKMFKGAKRNVVSIALIRVVGDLEDVEVKP